jgi:hypothetical protein
MPESEAWAARVRANREQVEQHREAESGADFYAPVASLFRADPRRTDDLVLDVLRGLVQPGDALLDVTIEYISAHSPVAPKVEGRTVGP